MALERKSELKPGKGLVRKTPLKAVGSQMRRTRIRSVSPREASKPKNPPRSRSAVPDKVRRALTKRSKGLCEAGTHLCVGVAREAQHRITQKGGGRKGEAKVHHDRLSNLLHCCVPCHRHITGEPALSYDAGWSCREGADTSAKPVWMRGVRVLLGDDGSVVPCEPQEAAA